MKIRLLEALFTFSMFFYIKLTFFSLRCQLKAKTFFQ